MTDLAKLVLEVDASQVIAATTALDQLTAAGTKAEASTGARAKSSKTATAALEAEAGATDSAAKAADYLFRVQLKSAEMTGNLAVRNAEMTAREIVAINARTEAAAKAARADEESQGRIILAINSRAEAEQIATAREIVAINARTEAAAKAARADEERLGQTILNINKRSGVLAGTQPVANIVTGFDSGHNAQVEAARAAIATPEYIAASEKLNAIARANKTALLEQAAAATTLASATAVSTSEAEKWLAIVMKTGASRKDALQTMLSEGGSMRLYAKSLMDVGTLEQSSIKTLQDKGRALYALTGQQKFYDDLVLNSAKMAGTSGAVKLAADFKALTPASGEVAGALKEVEKGSVSAILGLSRVRTEIVVLAHEMLSGRFSRIPASLMVLAEYAGAHINLFTAMSAAIIGATATAITFGIAVKKSEESARVIGALTREFEAAGHGADFTRTQVKALVTDLYKLPDVSLAAAQGIVAAFAHSGQASAMMIRQLANLAPDLAAAMGDTPVKAAEELAKAFDGTAAGALKLDKQLNFLSVEQIAQLEHMQKMHDSVGIMNLAYGALADRIEGLAEHDLTSMQKATRDVESAWASLIVTLGDSSFVSSVKDGVTGALEWLAKLLKAEQDVAKHPRGLDLAGVGFAVPDRGPVQFQNPLSSELLRDSDSIKQFGHTVQGLTEDVKALHERALASAKKGPQYDINVLKDEVKQYREAMATLKSEGLGGGQAFKDFEVGVQGDLVQIGKLQHQLDMLNKREHKLSAIEEMTIQYTDLAEQAGKTKTQVEDFYDKIVKNPQLHLKDTVEEMQKALAAAQVADQHTGEQGFVHQLTIEDEKQTKAIEAQIEAINKRKEAVGNSRAVTDSVRSSDAAARSIEAAMTASLIEQANITEGPYKEALLNHAARLRVVSAGLAEVATGLSEVSLAEQNAAGAKMFDDQIKAIQELQAAQDKKNLTLGDTKEVADQVRAANEDLTASIIEQSAADYERVALMEGPLTAAQQDEIRRLQELAQAHKNLAESIHKTAELQATADVAADWKNTIDRIEGQFRNAWDKIGAHGKSVWQDMTKAFHNMFKTSVLDYIYKELAKPFVLNVIASVAASVGATGMAQAATTAAGQGIGGSLLSTGAQIAGAGSLMGAGSSLGAFGASVSGGYTAGANGIIGTFGMGNGVTGVAGTAASYVGAAMPYIMGAAAGYFGGKAIAGDKKIGDVGGGTAATAGTIIGTVLGGPIGGAIGGAIGGSIVAAFGMGPKKTGPTNLVGTFSQSGFTGDLEADWKKKGGWFRSDKTGTDVTALTDQQAQMFGAVAAGNKAAFDRLSAAAGESTKSLDGWSFAVKQPVNSLDDLKKLSADVGNNMGEKLMPELVAFQQTGESLADTAVRLADEFRVTDKLALLMGKDTVKAFGAIGMASAQVRDNLATAAGGISNLSSMVQTYYSDFFNASGQLANDTKSLTDAFTALGIGMPTSKTEALTGVFAGIPKTIDDFKTLVNAQDLSTAAGQQMFVTLMQLAPAFASVQKEAKALADQQTNLEIKLLGLVGDSTGALAKQREMELAALDATLVPLQQQVYAQEDLATAYDTANAALNKLKLETADSFKTVADYSRYLSHAANAGISGAQEALPASAANTFVPGVTNNDANAAFVEAVNKLRSELQAGQISMAVFLSQTAKTLLRWEGNGMPPTRDAA